MGVFDVKKLLRKNKSQQIAGLQSQFFSKVFSINFKEAQTNCCEFSLPFLTKKVLKCLLALSALPADWQRYDYLRALTSPRVNY